MLWRSTAQELHYKLLNENKSPGTQEDSFGLSSRCCCSSSCCCFHFTLGVATIKAAVRSRLEQWLFPEIIETDVKLTTSVCCVRVTALQSRVVRQGQCRCLAVTVHHQRTSHCTVGSLISSTAALQLDRWWEHWNDKDRNCTFPQGG